MSQWLSQWWLLVTAGVVMFMLIATGILVHRLARNPALQKGFETVFRRGMVQPIITQHNGLDGLARCGALAGRARRSDGGSRTTVNDVSVNPLRYLAVLLLAVGSVAVPCAQAQEVEPQVDSTALGDWFVVSLGARLDIRGVASPGVTGQLTVTPRPGRVWFSMGFLAQMRRWTVQYDPHTRRDQVFLRRYAIGVGTDGGPSAFVFLEGGTGRIETYPDSLRGKTYGLFGVGLGAGYTVGRVTATVDLSHGETRRRLPKQPSYPVDLYTILGVSARCRLF